MRHPSVLGAATREWRALVHTAADVAEALLAHVADHPDARGIRATQDRYVALDAGLVALLDYPRPKLLRGPSVAEGTARAVDITVARPRGSAGSDPLDLLTDRVEHLRNIAWALAEAGTSPAPALANLAAIGVLVNRVAAEAAERAARVAAPDRPSASHSEMNEDEDRASRAHAGCARWSVVAGILADVRTPHPPTSSLQLDRLDLARLLEETLRAAGATDLPRVARELDRIAARYSEVAELNVRAVLTAQERGELYVLGRALPHDALVRRPDLLDAKLTGRLVPAPAMVVRRLEAAYGDVIDGVSLTEANDGAPPAA